MPQWSGRPIYRRHGKDRAGEVHNCEAVLLSIFILLTIGSQLITKNKNSLVARKFDKTNYGHCD